MSHITEQHPFNNQPVEDVVVTDPDEAGSAGPGQVLHIVTGVTAQPLLAPAIDDSDNYSGKNTFKQN